MRKKVYGQSQRVMCAVCGGTSTAKNAQNIPTCQKHKSEELNLKCACGDWLDVKESKYGTFFVCMDCGPVNYKKGLEVNDLPLASIENL